MPNPMPGQLPKPQTPAGGVDTTPKPPQNLTPGMGQRPPQFGGQNTLQTISPSGQNTAQTMQSQNPGTQPIDSTGGLKVSARSPTNPGNWFDQPPSWYNQAPSWYQGHDNTNAYTNPPAAAGPPAAKPQVAAKPPVAQTPAPAVPGDRNKPVPNLPTNPAGAPPGVVGGRVGVAPPTGGQSIRDYLASRNGQPPPSRGVMTPTNGTAAADRLGQSGGSIKDYLAARNGQPVSTIGDSTLARGYSTLGQPDNAPQAFGRGGGGQGRQGDPTMRNDRYYQKGAPTTPLQRALEQSGQTQGIQQAMNGLQQGQQMQPGAMGGGVAPQQIQQMQSNARGGQVAPQQSRGGKIGTQKGMRPPQQIDQKIGAKGTKGGRVQNAKAGSGKNRGGGGVKIQK